MRTKRGSGTDSAQRAHTTIMRALRREIDQEMSEAQTALEEAHARQTLQDQLNETLQVRLTGLEGIATELRALVAAREAKVMDLEALLKRRDEDLGSANARIRDLEALVKEAGGQVKEASAAMKARDRRLHAAEEELVGVPGGRPCVRAHHGG